MCTVRPVQCVPTLNEWIICNRFLFCVVFPDKHTNRIICVLLCMNVWGSVNETTCGMLMVRCIDAVDWVLSRAEYGVEFYSKWERSFRTVVPQTGEVQYVNIVGGWRCLRWNSFGCCTRFRWSTSSKTTFYNQIFEFKSVIEY